MEHIPHSVSDVMTHTVIAVGRHAVFKEIVKTLEQWKVSALPVLEVDGRVVGVVSEADLLLKEEFRDHDPDRFETPRGLSALAKAGAMTAGELMTSPAISVHADATLPEAARLMARRRVKRMPVVSADGFLEGIVSRSDLLKVFLREDDDIAQEVREQLRELFPAPPGELGVAVEEGVVTLTGAVRDAVHIPLAVRVVRGVEGVVGVDCRLTGVQASNGAPAPRTAGPGPDRDGDPDGK